MAKYECNLKGSFHAILSIIDSSILRGSISASYENGSDYEIGNVRCAVRVYERYSMTGSNRVSLNVTLLGNGENNFLSAITSGGSQAMLFKMNTMGEEAFLQCLVKAVESYRDKE